jgi:hypothetical protein
MPRKRKSSHNQKVKAAMEMPRIKHMFDPACECEDCMSKRGKTFQFITLIPNLPDGSVGIATLGESSDDTYPNHLRRLQDMKLGVGKGRTELRQQRNRKPSPDTIQQDAEIAQMHEAGRKWSVIGAHFGITTRSAMRAYRRHLKRQQRPN